MGGIMKVRWRHRRNLPEWKPGSNELGFWAQAATMYTNYMTTPLRYETTAADIYTSLQRIPRTGWVIRGVENPETVYDHTVALVLLADTVAKEIGLSTDEIARLAKELDKYQALQLALQYEAEQGIPLFIEFYEYCKRDWPFSNPVILQRVADLREKHADNIDKK